MTQEHFGKDSQRTNDIFAPSHITNHYHCVTIHDIHASVSVQQVPCHLSVGTQRQLATSSAKVSQRDMSVEMTSEM